MNQTALEKPSALAVEISQYPDANGMDKLLKTLWGKPGELLFRQKNLETNIRSIEKLFWVCFKRNSYCFMMFAMVYQRLGYPSYPVNLFLIRYFFSPRKNQEDSKVNSPVIKSKKLKTEGKSRVRNLAANLFNNPSDLPHAESGVSKSMYFAYIEKGNSASMEMAVSMDFIPLRAIQSLPFCRWNPKISKRVQKANDYEKYRLCGLLEDYYREYSFFRSEEIFSRGEYFVLHSEGRIAAGVQVIQNEMILEEMKGLKGFFSLKILPCIPGLYKRIDPGNYKYLLLGSVYVRTGMDDLLPELFESVLAIYKLHTSLLWTDGECISRKNLLRTGERGVLSLLFPQVTVQCVARYQGFNDREISEMKRKKQFVCISDLV